MPSATRRSTFSSDKNATRNPRNKGSGSIDWHAMHDFCLQYSNLLRQRELEVVDNIAHWRGDLTEKQRGWLTSIYTRLRSAS
jgi:hypothetical protein